MSHRAHRWLDQAIVRRLARTTIRPRGAILMLHQVAAEPAASDFAPNRPWTVSSALLIQALDIARELGLEAVTLDEGLRRLTTPGAAPFLCLSFDDGYRDNAEIAWPLCRDRGVPIIVYVTTGFCRRRDLPWWIVLEAAIARSAVLSVPIRGHLQQFNCDSLVRKQETFVAAEALLRGLDPRSRVVAGRAIADQIPAGVLDEIRELFLDEGALARFAKEEGVSIGGHSVSHATLSRSSEAELEIELAQCATELEQVIGRRPRHFAYPFGGREEVGPREFRAAASLGYRSAVTTRHGVVRGRDHRALFELPRLALLAHDDAASIRSKLSGVSTMLNPLRRRRRTLAPPPDAVSC